MLKSINSYVTLIVVVSIITSMMMTITHKSSTKAIIALVSGLALMIVLLKPLAFIKNLNPEILISLFNGNNMSAHNNYNTLRQDNLLKELIADKTSAYILAKAQALDVVCQVNVTVSDDEIPVPEAVVISGQTTPNTNVLEELRGFLAFDCGIPKENQLYLWG